MTWGRFLSSSAAVAAVAGCAVLAVGMSAAATRPAADRATPSISATATPRPAYVLPTPVPDTSSSAADTAAESAAPAPSTAPSTASRAPARATAAATTAAPARRPATPAAAPARRATSASAPQRRAAPARVAVRVVARGQALPLAYSTGTATRVITVVAGSRSSTTAQLQAWTKVTGGWLRYGSPVLAHIGSDGMTTSPSEFRSATPMGAHTLTQAFGRYSDPGTALPYFQTDPDDYWVSAPGATYNTHQRCYSNCNSANEHLYYEVPYYDYAVVIDTPSGSSAYPHGSAFFLHVTDGRPTAGCVAIAQTTLVTLMRWLTPSAHPRILIGTA